MTSPRRESRIFFILLAKNPHLGCEIIAALVDEGRHAIEQYIYCFSAWNQYRSSTDKRCAGSEGDELRGKRQTEPRRKQNCIIGPLRLLSRAALYWPHH